MDQEGEKMKKSISTKFGKAYIAPEGYYVIYTRNENRTKKLHRLIWEDFYGCEIPKGYVIHHKDGNKLNNCILNLQLLSDSEHKSLHKIGENHPFYGKNMSESSRKKMSETNSKLRNTTGIYGLTKLIDDRFSQGFRWGFHYRDEDGKRRFISSVNLEKLKQKVFDLGLEWRVLDES